MLTGVGLAGVVVYCVYDRLEGRWAHSALTTARTELDEALAHWKQCDEQPAILQSRLLVIEAKNRVNEAQARVQHSMVSPLLRLLTLLVLLALGLLILPKHLLIKCQL